MDDDDNLEYMCGKGGSRAPPRPGVLVGRRTEGQEGARVLYGGPPIAEVFEDLQFQCPWPTGPRCSII